MVKLSRAPTRGGVVFVFRGIGPVLVLVCPPAARKIGVFNRAHVLHRPLDIAARLVGILLAAVLFLVRQRLDTAAFDVTAGAWLAGFDPHRDLAWWAGEISSPA